MAPDVKFTQNRLGGVALVIDGCKYRINRRSGQTVYWRCFFRWCRANAVVEAGRLKSSCGVHICSQPLKGRHHHQPEPTASASASAASAPPPPVAAAASAKMATRAARQDTATALHSKNALHKAKKSLTNNNMVVRGKGKSTNKKSGDHQPAPSPSPPSPSPPPASVDHIKCDDSAKQVSCSSTRSFSPFLHLSVETST